MIDAMADLVSTIIPVHNRASLLREAVASVLAQTHQDIEVIIVDDGSTDGTAAMADEIGAGHPRKVHVLHQPNGGAGTAREAGRRLARGQFIQYLDSDDLLLPTKFEQQVAALRAHPECAVAYGKTRFGQLGTPVPSIAWKRTGERIETMFPSFLLSRWWGTSTPLYRRSACDAAGPWLNLLNEEDWEYDCRIAALGTRLCFVDDFVSEEREHGGPRLSRGGTTDPAKLRDRAQAHALVFGHALRSGMDSSMPEMQQFSRSLFLLSRQCGAAGLPRQSRDLFDLARQACGPVRGNRRDFRLYGLAARLVGWKGAGRLAGWADQLRK